MVNGHDHDYERFVPLDPAGHRGRGARDHARSSAGTGGAACVRSRTRTRTAEVRDAAAHGVLRLDLRPGAYDWEFIPVPGGSFTDAGAGTCH